jgi:secreted PhoX family phosphatase
VAWHDGTLYETEDRGNACFYRYLPGIVPAAAGELAADSAAGGGTLQALRLPTLNPAPTTPFDTRPAASWPGGVGASHDVDWVPIATPNPGAQGDGSDASVRQQGHAQGGAFFDRTEGCWSADGKIYFDCTTGGGTSTATGQGQVWELDPASSKLTLLYEAPPGDQALRHPDNIVVTPTGDLFLCEDAGESASEEGGDAINSIRGLTPDGRIFDFARAITNGTEFCGACFDPNDEVLYVNQQGNPRTDALDPPLPGVTYAIWGPWHSKAKDEVV